MFDSRCTLESYAGRKTGASQVEESEMDEAEIHTTQKTQVANYPVRDKRSISYVAFFMFSCTHCVSAA